MGLFVAALLAGWLSACDDGVPHLELVRDCKSDAQCVAPLTDWQDETAPLDDRARSYLHANCSSCHTSPEGFCTGDLAARPALAAMGKIGPEIRLPMTEITASARAKLLSVMSELGLEVAVTSAER